MKSEKSNILSLVRAHAEKILTEDLPEHIFYHSIDHTRDVVDAAVEIGRNCKLNDEEMEILQIAAWFHDLGYVHQVKNHEQQSVEMSEDFLRNEAYPKHKIDRVTGCIMATQMPQNPKNLIEEVLCDADLIHLGMDEYFEKSSLLREELEAQREEVLTEKEWMEKNKSFMKAHQFFTPYAQEIYDSRVRNNLEKVDKRLKKIKKNAAHVEGLEKEISKLKEKLKNTKELTPTRGIETMFRLTSKNHLDLSAMADTKANIMISVNSIILSVLVSVLFRKLDQYPHLILPAVIMTIVCLSTIVFAILATRPNVSKGTFTRQDIESKRTNLLFFGNFHNMNMQDYEWGMKQMMKDADYLYTSLIRDIYFLGTVLGKKYKLLRISYTIFMFGFVLSVLSFMIAEVFLKQPSPY